ncbi:MAG: multiheme c-type cytochrome, partial [bacterium]
MNIRPIILAAILTAIILIVSGCDNNTTWAPTGSEIFRYVGLAACAQCHSEICAEYPEQAHGLDFRVAHDRDLISGFGGGCAPCHTVGFDEPSGFVDDGTKTYLEGIGCEECHGMGNRHAAS